MNTTYNHRYIRNFCIISHIDHGKSTLADSLIVTTNPNQRQTLNTQSLDNLDLEKKHGITIKSNHIILDYKCNNELYSLCLIDTPGHVDFKFEVSRSLRACEGVLLVVDATRGIQGQTISNVNIAREHNLRIIPVINKIDLPNADIPKTIAEVEKYLEIDCTNCLKISAKKMININAVLEKIVHSIPAPTKRDKDVFQGLIFDSFFDVHKGVVLYVRIIAGTFCQNDELFLINNQINFRITKIFQKKISLCPLATASAGQIVIIMTNLKNIKMIVVGDTIIKEKMRGKVASIAGFVRPKPIIFSNFYLCDDTKFDVLTKALQKIKLNDDSLSFTIQRSNSFGMGYLCGFLGSLHRQIIKERLKADYSIDIMPGSPSVEYRIELKNKHETIQIFTPSHMPTSEKIKSISALFCEVKICTPLKYYGQILKYTMENGASFQNFSRASTFNYLLTVEMSLSQLIIDYFDKVKTISNGYASLSYELLDFRPVDVVKLEFLVNYSIVPPLAIIVSRSIAQKEGKRICERLAKLIPPCNFQVAIQAAIGGKIISRSTIKALRKNVTANLYGGDITRKMKLRKKQKEGKKRMKTFGRVFIPTNAFLKLNQQ